MINAWKKTILIALLITTHTSAVFANQLALKTCAMISNQNAVIKTLQKMESTKGITLTSSSVELAVQLYRAGYKDISKEWLSKQKTNKDNFLLLSNWSSVFPLIEAAKKPDLIAIDRILLGIKNSTLKAKLKSTIVPTALALFEHFEVLEQYYPIGSDIYSQNLNARTGIDFLVQAKKYDLAIKLYRKHQFGYHTKMMLRPILTGLYYSNNPERLSTFIAQEWLRAIDFRSIELCLAGGLSTSPKDKRACMKEEEEALQQRKLELFDSNAYINCILTPNRKTVKSCLQKIESRLKNSKHTFSKEALNENNYSFGVKLLLLKYQALNGSPDPKRIPAQTFKNIDLGDIDAISSVMVSMEQFAQKGSGQPLFDRFLKALKIDSKKKYTGVATIFQMPSTDKLSTLLNYAIYNRSAIHATSNDVNGFRELLSIIPQNQKENRKSVSFALALLFAKQGKKDQLSLILKKFTDKNLEYKFNSGEIYKLSMAAKDNGFSELASQLKDQSKSMFCETKIDFNDRWSVIPALRFVKNYFLAEEISRGKLPHWVIRK